MISPKGAKYFNTGYNPVNKKGITTKALKGRNTLIVSKTICQENN